MIEEEEEQNWFTRWEEELPRPEELMPLSQSLITPDLALAFDIPSPNPNLGGGHQAHGIAGGQNPPHGLLASADFESADQSSPAGDEPARTLKRPRLVWTPQLHKRFVDAVAHLGIKNAVPKTIMQLMSVDGLTRENVASHLQKYRLYLKRMQGLSSSAASPPCQMSAVDAATEQLFAGSPIPHPFLAGRTAQAGAGQEPFMQFMSPPLLQHHQQMAAAAAAAAAAQHQFYHQRQMGHFTYDNGFHSRGVVQPGGHRMGVSGLGIAQASPSVLHHPNSYGEDADSVSGGGRRVLTLFPTNTDD